jgi:hypothetical protein
MPCSDAIWKADSAEAWQKEMLKNGDRSKSTQLTLSNFLQDTGVLNLQQHHVDVQMSLRIMVSIFWLRVWQFIVLRAFSSPEGSNPKLGTVDHSFQQLVATGQDLIVRFCEGSESMHPCVRMMLELGLMHLHVSLEDIQLLAGKEGEEQARKAASRLRLWITVPESRRALFHAGQIARTAAQCPIHYLRGFHAVVIYHASLTMWAYALLENSQSNVQTAHGGYLDPNDDNLPTIQLDGDETPQLRRFILLGNGTAFIRRYSDSSDDKNVAENSMLPLTDAAEVMLSMAALLSSRDESEDYCIPIVSYLTRLMRSLANASAAMRLLR